MRTLLSLLLVALTTPALAGEPPGDALRLMPGGAARSSAVGPALGVEAMRLDLGESARLRLGPVLDRAGSASESAGLSAASGFAPPRGLNQALAFGGFLAIEFDAYGFDGSFQDGRGGTAADIGASYLFGGEATAYALRLGAGWTPADDEPFSVTPGGRLVAAGSAETDVNLSLTFTHAFTPNFFVSGKAAVKRLIGDGIDGSEVADQSRFVFGAGLGLRF